jgi:hypothetical protein
MYFALLEVWPFFLQLLASALSWQLLSFLLLYWPLLACYMLGEGLSSQPSLCAMLLHLLFLAMSVVASTQGMVVWFFPFGIALFSCIICLCNSISSQGSVS